MTPKATHFDGRNVRALLAWLVVSFAAAAIGGFFRPGAWYAALAKPAWHPPAWVFAPVWTALYASMGVAAWMVWRQGGFAVQRVPLTFFLAQLLLNALWSPLFFGWHKIGLALAEIVLLWCCVLATVTAFWKARRAAGALLLPYLAWVSFAVLLNLAIWRLNG